MRGKQIAVGLLMIGSAFALTGAIAIQLFKQPEFVETFVPPPDEPTWLHDYDLNVSMPELIAPGTIVENTPPRGWSHLIIKSLPRVKPSEVERLPTNPLVGRDGLVRQVAWMFTVFTADVVNEPPSSHWRYRLRAIGLGLGANVNGHDTVLTVESADQLGIKLDPIQAITLTTGYRVQQQSRVVVLGPTFALVDTPVTFRCNARNHALRFRYALVVDNSTGKLDVFAWRLGSENGQCVDLTRAVLLHPNTIDEAELVADLEEFKLGIPNERAFGVEELPPHRLEVALPVEIRSLAGQTRFTHADVYKLERALRQLIP